MPTEVCPLMHRANDLGSIWQNVDSEWRRKRPFIFLHADRTPLNKLSRVVFERAALVGRSSLKQRVEHGSRG
jgi:hypothetical protein